MHGATLRLTSFTSNAPISNKAPASNSLHRTQLPFQLPIKEQISEKRQAIGVSVLRGCFSVSSKQNKPQEKRDNPFQHKEQETKFLSHFQHNTESDSSSLEESITLFSARKWNLDGNDVSNTEQEENLCTTREDHNRIYIFNANESCLQ